MGERESPVNRGYMKAILFQNDLDERTGDGAVPLPKATLGRGFRLQGDA
jgi:hypothetical protein